MSAPKAKTIYCMKYLGGKYLLSKHLSPLLQSAIDDHKGRFFEPFVGGFNLVPRLNVDTAMCTDVHVGLVNFWLAVQSGWLPPEFLSEHEYKRLQQLNDFSDPMTAFAAFGCSFGGKEWGGYARGLTGSGDARNYANEARNNIIKKAAFMDPVIFSHGSYSDFEPVNTCVYCDPPYRGTTSYKVGAFNYEKFYAWCEKATREGSSVFVSEFDAPSNWGVVWSKERKIAVSGKKNSLQKTEKLFKVAI